MVTLSFEVSEEISTMFGLIALVLKLDYSKAFEKMVKDYSSMLTDKNKSPEKINMAFSYKIPISPYCKAFNIEDEKYVSSKALSRMRQWAHKPNQLNHQCIRAFLQCAHGDEADRQKMKMIFMQNTGCSAHQFDINLVSMSTDSGNSHGRVFELIGDRVILVKEVKAELKEYENYFKGG